MTETTVKVKAEMGAYSSVVGNGVHLLAEDGRMLGQVAILCHADDLRDKYAQEALCRTICDAINAPAGPVTVSEAAKVLLANVDFRNIDPFDACDPEVEALAVKYAGNRGDAVMQLEIAEEFFRAALRSLAEGEGNG